MRRFKFRWMSFLILLASVYSHAESHNPSEDSRPKEESKAFAELQDGKVETAFTVSCGFLCSGCYTDSTVSYINARNFINWYYKITEGREIVDTVGPFFHSDGADAAKARCYESLKNDRRCSNTP